jgi:hypothetical protein
MPCSTIALLTGKTLIRIAINTTPPAMPTKPDRTLVANALTMINRYNMDES